MDKNKICIVTIMNSISETSMPFNEFVLYRNKNYLNQKQVIIVCSNSKSMSMYNIPENIEIYYVGLNIREIRRIMIAVSKRCNTDGIPMIIHLHQPKSGLIFHLSSIFLGFNKKVLFTVHSTYKSRDLKWKTMSILNALLAKKVTIVSKTAFESYPNWMKKLKGSSIVPLPNGVDSERIDSIIQDVEHVKKAVDEVKTLVYVSRMAPFKNHIFLLKVLSHLQNYKLVLIGEEDKDGRVRDFIINNQMTDKVEITGLLSRNEVFVRLKQADIYLSPSLVEGLPVSVLEAMYVGLPIIISDIDPHKEISKNNNFIQTLPLEEQKWVQVLLQYIDKDRDALEAIGKECKICAKRYYSLMAMHQQYDIIYNSFINED